MFPPVSAPRTRAVILSAVRTPIRPLRRRLAGCGRTTWPRSPLRAAVDRAGSTPGEIEDVYLGCANQAGEDNRDVARMAVLLAGLPESVAGVTVNRLCASGLSAVVSACHAVIAGDGDLFVAGGVESMTPRAAVSRSPTGRARAAPHALRHDARLAIPQPAAGGDVPAGEHGRDRRERRRAVACRARIRMRSRCARSGAGPRRTGGPLRRRAGRRRRARARRAPAAGHDRREAGALRPAFREGGTVTAGNSSG